MPDNIGGFYATLKLSVDDASFTRGYGWLRKIGTESEKWDIAAGKRRSKEAREQSALLKLKQQVAKEEAKNLDNQKKSTENATTSIKWMMGAAIAAIAVMKKFGDALGDAFARGNVTQVNAKQLSMSGSRLTALKNALDIALNRDTGDAAAESMLNIQQRFAEPQWGEFNKDFATKLGVLGQKTGRTDLAWEALSKMGNEERIFKIMSAITQLSKKDMASAVGLGNALVGNTVTAAATSGVFNAGVGQATTWINDKDVDDLSRMGREVMELTKNFQGMWDKFSAGFARNFVGFLDQLNNWMESNKNPINNTVANALNPLRTADAAIHSKQIFDLYYKENPKAKSGLTLNDLPPEFIDKALSQIHAQEKGASALQKLSSLKSMWKTASALEYTKWTGMVPPANFQPYNPASKEGAFVLNDQPSAPSEMKGWSSDQKAIFNIYLNGKFTKQEEIDFAMKHSAELGLNK